jgi:phage tail sheath protein FI
MAERIVSPGVFTRERDLSFLPQAIGEIGAAIIGPTKKGPAFTPTQVSNFQEFEEIFGGVDKRFYTPYTVEQYLRSAGVVTVVRVLGLGGYKVDSISIMLSRLSYSQSLAVLAPSRGSSGTGDLSKSVLSGSNFVNTWSSMNLIVSGTDVTAVKKEISFNTSSANWIGEVFSADAQVQKFDSSTTAPVYLYKVFKGAASDGILGPTLPASASLVLGSDGINFQGGATSIDSKGNASSYTGNVSYNSARTPYIQSQKVSGVRYDLFRVYSRSHGTDINSQIKVAILNVKPAADVAGSDYGTFSLQVRVNNPGGTNHNNVLEQWDNVTIDPDSANFFAKRIGDKFVVIDSDGKLTYYGNYPNLSKHIRIGDYTDETNNTALESMPKTVVPMGHKKVKNPVPGGANVPTASLKTSQTTTTGDFDGTVFYGFDFDNENSKQYLAPIIYSASTGSNVSMSLEDQLGHNDASTFGSKYSAGDSYLTLTGSATQQLKFQVPFQWGFDGRNPATAYSTADDIATTNTQGFDLSSGTTSGSIAYKRAINSVSNPDEFDINLLVTPGVLHRLHSAVTNHAISKVESRADAFYVMDAGDIEDSIQTTITAVKALDTNYAACYYPWVRIVDRDTNRPVWVPPSVVLPGVIAFNDKVAHEWFAPAGLNRGGLTTVTEAYSRLTHSERDDLYESRINPIATFPGQGVVVFGQKTLQAKPSALDRVNVRRLLIALKKFIASSSKYLVFEQNSTATRQRFLNIVNPYLESVQQNSGLSAFRVVMDDSNNPPDVVDRNQLVGQIFIQPTRTAEFIVLDFVVQPTGAVFPE